MSIQKFQHGIKLGFSFLPSSPATSRRRPAHRRRHGRALPPLPSPGAGAVPVRMGASQARPLGAGASPARPPGVGASAPAPDVASDAAARQYQPPLRHFDAGLSAVYQYQNQQHLRHGTGVPTPPPVPPDSLLHVAGTGAPLPGAAASALAAAHVATQATPPPSLSPLGPPPSELGLGGEVAAITAEVDAGNLTRKRPCSQVHLARACRLGPDGLGIFPHPVVAGHLASPGSRWCAFSPSGDHACLCSSEVSLRISVGSTSWHLAQAYRLGPGGFGHLF